MVFQDGEMLKMSVVVKMMIATMIVSMRGLIQSVVEV